MHCNLQAAVEQLRRAVARVGAQKALLAAQLAAREPTPAPPAAAPAAVCDAGEPAIALPGRIGAAVPGNTAAAAGGGEACAAPGGVLPSGTGSCVEHGAVASQEPPAAKSALLPEDSCGDRILAWRGTVVAQEPSSENAKHSTGPEAVAAALARRVAALVAERRVLKALARLSLAVTTDVLTGAHTSGLHRGMRVRCGPHAD